MKLTDLSPHAKEILRQALSERYEDYKERLVYSGDELMRGRCLELKDLLSEVAIIVDNEP